MHPLSQAIYDDVAAVARTIDFAQLSGKQILITGGSGIVGTYFLASLARGLKERSLDAKVTAVVQSEPDLYWRELLPAGSVVIKGDLSENAFLERLPKADLIIHAAGYAQPGRFMADPVKTLKLNTVATFALCEKLLPGGTFLFVSSSELYSGSKETPYREESIGVTNTTHPRSCYIEGKRSGEAISFAYKSKGMNTKAARLSLVYGPGTKKGDQRVHNSIIEKGLRGAVSLMDAGLAKRTYCYVTDAVESMWQVALLGKEFVYNVGGESKTTIAELAQKVAAGLKVSITIPEAGPGLAGAPEDVSLDLSRIKAEFGKTQFVPFDEGLRRTIAWQKILYGEEA